MLTLYLVCVCVCVCVCVLVAQSCPTLCNPIDSSPPGLYVHGILQARTLEWVAISFSKRNYRKKESEVFQLCLILRPHGLQPIRLLHPWNFPGKSTGVGCHFFLHLYLVGAHSCFVAVSLEFSSLLEMTEQFRKRLFFFSIHSLVMFT